MKDDEKISDLKPYEVLLSPNPNPTEPKRRVKAVCNHIYTASLARISPYLVGYPERKPMFPRISDGDMARVCQAMLDGVVALRTFHEQEIERVRAELQGKMAGEIDEEVMRRLDEMTRP